MIPEEYLDKIHCCNCKSGMKKIPDNSVDLVFTSPPYADLRNYGHTEGTIDPEDYMEWFAPVCQEIFRILKPTGSFVLNVHHGETNTSAGINLWCYRLLIDICDNIGFQLSQDMYWIKPDRLPLGNSAKYIRCRQSTEFLFWLAKDNSKVKSNTKNVLRYDGRERIQQIYEKQNVHKNFRRISPAGHAVNDYVCDKYRGGATPFNFIIASVGISNDPFQKLQRKLDIKHVARFPEKLPEFFIKMLTEPGDIIVDPFIGSGTTAVVAKKLGRKYLGFELNEKYVELANARLSMEFDQVDNTQKLSDWC